jgi:ABC-type sugar transport system substrate-binding protein
MSSAIRKRRRQAAAVVVLAVVLALVVAATGSSSRSATPLQQAQAYLKKAMQKPKSLPIKPSSKPIPKGKFVVYVHCGATACNALADGASKAAKVLGWKYQTIATQGTPESVKAAFATAVRLKPNAVISSGWDRATYESELQELKKMGTGVFNYSTLDKPGTGITVMVGDVNGVGVEGTQLAAWVVSDTKGKANTLFVDVPAYTILQGVTRLFKSNYAKWCPGCPLDTMQMPATALGKDAPDRVVSYLRSHPDVNYVAFSLDAAAIGLPAALRAAGLNGKVKFVGASPTVENLGYVASGDEAATVNQPYYETQAILMDAAARYVTGQSLAQDQSYQIQYFVETKGNLARTSGFGPVVPDLYGKLKKIWRK